MIGNQEDLWLSGKQSSVHLIVAPKSSSKLKRLINNLHSKKSTTSVYVFLYVQFTQMENDIAIHFIIICLEGSLF